MLRPVWCNNGGTKSSACRSCIVVYSRVMIFWFSNTVYFCMIGLNLFSIGAGNCAMQLFGRDLIVKHVSPHACPKFSRQTLPDNSISSDLSKKDAIRAESLSCRPSSPPLVCLAKRCKREKKRINDDPMLITLGANPWIHRYKLDWKRCSTTTANHQSLLKKGSDSA